MKLLVLAQTPPPVHGQSVMVRTLLEGLPARGIAVHHVNLAISRDAADIGRWRPGKIVTVLSGVVRALAARFRHGCDTLYYVPAPPGKRGALYRDWVIMALCRPFYPRIVLHWHASGLSEWMLHDASAIERGLSRGLLGRAQLAIILAPELRADAEFFLARRAVVVPNGVEDGGAPVTPPPAAPFQLLFLGLGSEEKGLFAAAEAVVAANRECGSPPDAPAFALTAAGNFDNEDSAIRFARLREAHPDALRHIGPIDAAEKAQWFAQSHALLFPTHYPAEGMPLVALESLAHDRPVIATCWRALPSIVTADVGLLVTPGDHPALVAALHRLRDRPPTPGVCRARFEAKFTLAQHLAALHAALASIDLDGPR